MTSPEARGVGGWMERRRLRYKRHETVGLDDVRGDLKTGDIIMFHKTTRSGVLDTIEMDVLAPLFFPENEFRHSGLVVRRGDELSVVECTDEYHSGHDHAEYPTGGKGIREVALEPLLAAYTRDNGEPHFGVRFIPQAIPTERFMSVVNAIGPVSYLKGSRSVALYLSSFVLPSRALKHAIQMHADQMMCSEFVHAVLAECGALREYPSKIFAPYLLENSHLFEKYDLVGYSEIVRFTIG